ncbi:hypothetical protein NE237_031248 [Protea cynaroides]|uniref:Uncharacterized protein n=1 Tax=Protea cynaroides TaxID=273540 RepID=A0A9Q0L159_9MAGN|nr:hypothetical protein NE237_031248 [Protea cynaroides]
MPGNRAESPNHALSVREPDQYVRRALVTMHKIPRNWVMYLPSLKEQKLRARSYALDIRSSSQCSPHHAERADLEAYFVFVSQRAYLLRYPLGFIVDTSNLILCTWRRVPSKFEPLTGGSGAAGRGVE